MAEVTRRRTGEFLRKLFEILMPHPDGMQARDALAALDKAVTLTEYESGTYESGGRRFDWRLCLIYGLNTMDGLATMLVDVCLCAQFIFWPPSPRRYSA